MREWIRLITGGFQNLEIKNAPTHLASTAPARERECKRKRSGAYPAISSAILVCGLALAANAGDPKPIYQIDFENAAIGEAPEDFLILDGQFAVKEHDQNKFIELPGAPLESFGFLFGPREKDGIAVTGRVFGTRSGRRYPTFAAGLNGVAGYRLQVSPAKRSIELYKGDAVQKSVSYSWKPDEWTHLYLQTRPEGRGWKIEGKVWQEREDEPREWMIAHEDDEEPYTERPSFWGAPYSGTPIRFDDLRVIPAQKQP